MNKIASSATSRATAILAIITVAAILAFAALLTLPLQAQPTTVTLVSNTHLSPSAFPTTLRGAQKFTTGTETDGYVISEVGIHVRAGGGGRTTTVTIRENSSSDRPGDLVDTLTNPLTFTNNDVNTFTAPPNLTLMANTDYWVSVNEGTHNLGTNQLNFDTVQNDAQTGQAGWEIDNNRAYRTTASGTWTVAGPSLMIEIRGTTGGFTASTDATLSDLALEDGSANEITLTPPFVTGTKSYTALVANSVSSITLTPTVNDANATVEYLDASDASITDTDTSTPALDAPLAVLDNTFKVKVTAEAGSTNTDTYTVVVTREAQAVDTHVLVSNTGQPKKSTFAHTPHAQRFVTGAAAAEFIISEVQIQLAVAAGKDTTIMIKENDSNNRPSNLVATLTNPATLTSNSLNTFTAPAGTTLAANTSYWITVNEGFIEPDGVSFPITESNAQTGEAGWSIDDGFLWKIAHTNNWYVAQQSLLIAIRGTAAVSTDPVSTDATLSDLTLADVDSNPVALAFDV